MSRYQELYWRLFNVLARVAGFAFVLVGSIFAAWGVALLLDKQAVVSANGIPTRDPWEKAIVLVAGVVAAAIGVLLLRAQRYRPDLGDRAFSRPEKKPLEKSAPHD